MILGMTSPVRVGTREGLWALETDQVFAVEALTGKSLTALAVDSRNEAMHRLEKYFLRWQD